MERFKRSLSQPNRLVAHSSTLLKSAYAHFFLKHRLTTFLVLSLVGGIFLGVVNLNVRSQSVTAREVMYLRFPGEMLLQLLSLLVVPLVVTSIVSGLTLVDKMALGKIGLRAAGVCLMTYFLAVILGLFVAAAILPRIHLESARILDQTRDRSLEGGFLTIIFDIIGQMIPDNFVEATFQRTYTEVKEKESEPGRHKSENHAQEKNDTSSDDVELEWQTVHKRGSNMLGLILLSTAAGVIINIQGDKALPLKVIFDALYEVTFHLINVIVTLMPVGILFLAMADVVAIRKHPHLFDQLSYFITVTASLLLHGLVVLPFLYFVVCRRNPYSFFLRQLRTMLTALTTASSVATLPITMRTLKESHVHPLIVDILAPIMACVHMNGIAINHAIAIAFISYSNGVALSLGQYLTIGMMAVLSALAALGVPQGGLDTVISVIKALGFSESHIHLILPLDWLLDRFLTCTNVLADCYLCAMVDKLSHRELARIEEETRDDKHLP